MNSFFSLQKTNTNMKTDLIVNVDNIDITNCMMKRKILFLINAIK